MSERDLSLMLVAVVVGVGFIYGALFARPRFSKRRRARGWRALLIRVLLWLWLVIILGYFGIFLPRFQQDLFGDERTLCPEFT